MKKKTKKKKPQVFWLWKDRGGFYSGRPWATRRAARGLPPFPYCHNDWRKAYADGWRIVKAKIVEVRK